MSMRERRRMLLTASKVVEPFVVYDETVGRINTSYTRQGQTSASARPLEINANANLKHPTNAFSFLMDFTDYKTLHIVMSLQNYNGTSGLANKPTCGYGWANTFSYISSQRLSVGGGTKVTFTFDISKISGNYGIICSNEEPGTYYSGTLPKVYIHNIWLE